MLCLIVVPKVQGHVVNPETHFLQVERGQCLAQCLCNAPGIRQPPASTQESKDSRELYLKLRNSNEEMIRIFQVPCFMLENFTQVSTKEDNRQQD